MKITKSQLKQLIKEEIQSIDEMSAALRNFQMQADRDPKFFEKHTADVKAYMERENAKIPGRIRELERKVDKIMDHLKIKE